MALRDYRGRRLGVPAAVLLLTAGVWGRPAAGSAAPLRLRPCVADCSGDGTVAVDELVFASRVALGEAALAECPSADSSGDRAVTVDELVRAVNAALHGCVTVVDTPTATRTVEPSRTAEPLVTATAGHTASSPPATRTPTRTAVPSRSLTPVLTAAPTGTASPTRTPDVPATAMPTATATHTVPVVSTPSVTLTATLAAPLSPTMTASASATRTRTVSATATPSATETAVPTSTPIPTGTRTAGPLGTRRFSIAPATSPLLFVIAQNTVFPLTGFEGYLDLTAGTPDPISGVASVDVTASSKYLSLDLNPDAPVVVCIRPLVPVIGAGVIACHGGVGLEVSVVQDHNLGEVGAGGFGEPDCAAAGGTVEGASDPHPGVCNGPVTIGKSAQEESGAGALFIGMDEELGTHGLPAEFAVETALPCGDEGAAEPTTFVFVSSHSRARIQDFGNVAGQVLEHEEPGENFSCENWIRENGPGRLLLSVPALHGLGGMDLINVFVLDD